jgi:hypothetical protein
MQKMIVRFELSRIVQVEITDKISSHIKYLVIHVSVQFFII